MKYIKMYEGRGISDSLKNEIANIYNLYVKTGYSIDNLFEFNLKLSNGNNKLIYIFISFIEGNYYGKFYVENKTYKIDFHLPIKCSKNKFIELIIHEFTHLIEYANIQDKKFEIPSYNSIKQALLKFNPKTKEMDYFKYMIYLTLDNEINANVAQTFNYLKSFNTNDKNVLRKKLDEYEKRKEYIKSISVNKDKFIEDIHKNQQVKNELEELNFLLLTKKIQNNYPFLTEINDIKVYISNWFNIFQAKIKKYLSKQENLINEVIESINTSENFNSEVYIIEEKINNFHTYINKL
jgi:hypothetical protein